MSYIKAFLRGEYGLKMSFWFGLVLGGISVSAIADNLQDAVWYLYGEESTTTAIFLQLIVIGLIITIMGLAFGVIRASF